MKLHSQTLPEDVCKQIALPLQETVVDYISLASVAQQAHWAVIGREFRSFHAYMDELGAELDLLIDTTAERMLAVGELPLGQVDYVARHSQVEPSCRRAVTFIKSIPFALLLIWELSCAAPSRVCRKISKLSCPKQRKFSAWKVRMS